MPDLGDYLNDAIILVGNFPEALYIATEETFKCSNHFQTFIIVENKKLIIVKTLASALFKIKRYWVPGKTKGTILRPQVL